jgi:hypothetical protein
VAAHDALRKREADTEAGELARAVHALEQHEQARRCRTVEPDPVVDHYAQRRRGDCTQQGSGVHGDPRTKFRERGVPAQCASRACGAALVLSSTAARGQHCGARSGVRKAPPPC